MRLPAKDFETIIFKLRDFVSYQETRLNGIYRLSDKLIGKQNVKTESVPMPKSDVSLESLQGQLEEIIIHLNRIGTETDSVLERLHEKI